MLLKQAFWDLSCSEVRFHRAHELQHQIPMAALRHDAHAHRNTVA